MVKGREGGDPPNYLTPQKPNPCRVTATKHQDIVNNYNMNILHQNKKIKINAIAEISIAL